MTGVKPFGYHEDTWARVMHRQLDRVEHELGGVARELSRVDSGAEPISAVPLDELRQGLFTAHFVSIGASLRAMRAAVDSGPSSVDALRTLDVVKKVLEGTSSLESFLAPHAPDATGTP